MAKIQLKGKFTLVMGAVPKGQNGLLVQNFEFTVPAYVDGFGDVKGKDEIWSIDIIGDKIKELNVTPKYEGKRAILDVFVNSNRFKVKETGLDAFAINAVLWKVELKD